NEDRVLPNLCQPVLFDHISVAGGMNIDAGKWRNRDTNFMGENYQRISLNDLYLNLTATLNDWVSAFASISFNNATTRNNPDAFEQFGKSEYSASYANNVNGNANNKIQIEQGFATFGNV